MSAMIDFFVALLKTIIYILIVIIPLFYISRAFYISWNRSFKFFWKYKILKKEYDQTSLDRCVDAIELDLKPFEFRMVQLKAGNHHPNEIIWIYKEVLRQNKYNEKKKD